MKRIAVLLLILLAGCSTAPLADLKDWCKPAKLGTEKTPPYGGVCTPKQVGGTAPRAASPTVPPPGFGFAAPPPGGLGIAPPPAPEGPGPRPSPPLGVAPPTPTPPPGGTATPPPFGVAPPVPPAPTSSSGRIPDPKEITVSLPKNDREDVFKYWIGYFK